MAAQMLKKGSRGRKGSRAASRDVEKQEKLKTIFIEPLAAIAAGFFSETKKDAISGLCMVEKLNMVIFLHK